MQSVLRKFLRLFVLLLPLVFLGVPTCDEHYLQQLARERDAQSVAEINNEGGGYGSVEQATPSATNDTAYSLTHLAAEDNCASLLEGPPRGLSCLHCMQEEARSQAKIISTLLYRSCLKNVATNVLVDGTFSFDPEFLMEKIALLSANGRRLFITYYLTNGSTQRRWKETQIEAFGTKISPEDFRENIKSNLGLQREYQALVTRLIPVIRFAAENGAVQSLIPALEDNLDRESFEVMLRLASSALPAGSNIHFGRSACPGCYPGNDSRIPRGVFEEVHTASAHVTVRNGIITNDGIGYHFDDAISKFGSEDAQHFDSLELWDLAELRDRAAELGSVFILWSASRQGLPTSRNGVSRFPLPKERTYEIPSYAEKEALISFLREGLQ